MDREQAALSKLIVCCVKEKKSSEKKRKSSKEWMKPWLRNRDQTSAYRNIFNEIKLRDSEKLVPVRDYNH